MGWPWRRRQRRCAASSQALIDLRPFGSSRTSAAAEACQDAATASGDIGVDAGRPDLVDLPVLGHDVTQFVLGDGVDGRSAGIACRVEDQHEVRRARRGRTHDRLLVALAQFDRHRVEQCRVDDGAEPAVVAGEVADVGDVEGRVGQTALGGLRLGQLDGGRRLVEPDGGEALFGKVQRRGGLAAAGVEHVAVEPARLDQRRDLRLRLADAPRRLRTALEFLGLAAVGGIEHFLCGCVVMSPVYQPS